MTRATGVEPLTGIRELRRNTTGEPGAKLRSPGMLIAAVESRAGQAVRMQASGAVRWTVAALQPAKWTGAEVPSAAWTEAEARRVMPATEAVPAGRACHPAEAVDHVVVAASAVAAAVAGPVAAAAVAGPVVAAEAVDPVVAEAVEVGGRHEKIQNFNSRTCNGEEDDASENS